MSDDSTGMGISIPAMLISYEDGEKLVNFLTSASDEEKVKASLSAEFKMKNPDNRVEYELWYSSVDDRARDFLSYFKQYAVMFGRHAKFTPHFVTWPCPNCDEEFKKEECVSDGLYCTAPYIYEKRIKANGRAIILEDLREKCVFKNYRKHNHLLWWAYMEHVHNQCYNSISHLCSKKAHKELNLDFGVTENCVNNAFQDKDFEKDSEELRLEAKGWAEVGSPYTPTLVINGVVYRGDLNPEDVKEAICAGFKDKPDLCVKNTGGVFTGVSPNTLIIVVVILLIVNVFLLCLYRRFSNKE